MESSRNISSPFSGSAWASPLGRMATSGLLTRPTMPFGVTRFQVARSRNSKHPPQFLPGDITTGFDGNMWFTEQAVDKFGRITPDGMITEFTGVSAPTSIAAGPDGNLW